MQKKQWQSWFSPEEAEGEIGNEGGRRVISTCEGEGHSAGLPRKMGQSKRKINLEGIKKEGGQE